MRILVSKLSDLGRNSEVRIICCHIKNFCHKTFQIEKFESGRERFFWQTFAISNNWSINLRRSLLIFSELTRSICVNLYLLILLCENQKRKWEKVQMKQAGNGEVVSWWIDCFCLSSHWEHSRWIKVDPSFDNNDSMQGQASIYTQNQLSLRAKEPKNVKSNRKRWWIDLWTSIMVLCFLSSTQSVFVKVWKPRNSHLCVHICTCIVIYSLIGSEDKEAWYLHIGHIRAGRSVVVMSSNSRLCNHQQPFTTDPNNSHRHQIPSFSCHLDLQFGEIHFLIWWNTFCNLNKYILQPAFIKSWSQQKLWMLKTSDKYGK